MELLKAIAALLCRGAPSFSRLETALLRGVERLLDEERANRLRQRIDSINLVQRIDGGREVNAYSMKSGKAAFDETFRLVQQDDEHKLATFSFNIPGQGHYKGIMWLIKGQLFSIEFDNPTEHALDQYPEDLYLEICI